LIVGEACWKWQCRLPSSVRTPARVCCIQSQSFKSLPIDERPPLFAYEGAALHWRRRQYFLGRSTRSPFQPLSEFNDLPPPRGLNVKSLTPPSSFFFSLLLNAHAGPPPEDRSSVVFSSLSDYRPFLLRTTDHFQPFQGCDIASLFFLLFDGPGFFIFLSPPLDDGARFFPFSLAQSFSHRRSAVPPTPMGFFFVRPFALFLWCVCTRTSVLPLSRCPPFPSSENNTPSFPTLKRLNEQKCSYHLIKFKVTFSPHNPPLPPQDPPEFRYPPFSSNRGRVFFSPSSGRCRETSPPPFPFPKNAPRFPLQQGVTNSAPPPQSHRPPPLLRIHGE